MALEELIWRARIRYAIELKNLGIEENSFYGTEYTEILETPKQFAVVELIPYNAKYESFFLKDCI